MEWLNIHTQTLDSNAFVGATPIERATWLCLLRFCIGQENGGRIIECSTWGDAKWQQMCRVKLKEVRTESELWYWEEFNLVVNFYPKKSEKIVKRNRRDGSKGGRPKKVENNPPDNPPVPENNTPRHNERVRVRVKVSGGKVNEKEGEGKGNGETGATPSKASPKGELTTTRRTWAQEKPEEFARMLATFELPDAKPMNVILYFRCKMETKKDGPIEREWIRRIGDLSAAEVFLIIANEPPDTVDLPSQFTEAAHRFQFTGAV